MRLIKNLIQNEMTHLDSNMQEHNSALEKPHYLSLRENWQAKAIDDGLSNQRDIKLFIELYLMNNYPHTYEVKHLTNEDKISFNDDTKYGFVPDLRIRNNISNKYLFLENKKQKAEGNVQERACRYLDSSGLCSRIKKLYPTGKYAVLLTFGGEMITDQKYIDDITTTFANQPDSYLLDDGTPINRIKFIEEKVLPLLD